VRDRARAQGFGGVQITPPAEHKQGSQVWWTVYQPVSFKNFNSFGGSEAELRSMIARCNAAGVKVYADAVFNQLASGSGTATGGGSYNSGQYQYPQFGYNDFHHSGDITNYGDSNNVWNGALYGMPDLNTGSSYVQDQIATYMKTLLGWGVAGFRIDAAKHMAPADVKAILDKGQPQGLPGGDRRSGESSDIQPGRYTYIDTVTDFKYGTDLAANFNGQIKNLKTLGESWGLLPPTRPSSSWSTTTANAATAVAACSPS
jgi:alpha-amylase